ncbi:MAG: hypothetical protein K0R67_496 [Paenibacillus sp.]|nr:hypothetical protein [Paenibacillus sp.]
MKSIKISRELITMLAIMILLTGFSYALQPGRQAITEDNVVSVSVDSHTNRGYRNYNDTETIRAAVKVLTSMKEVPRESKGDYREHRNYTVRFNFRDGSARTYTVYYFIGGTTAYVTPFNTGFSYEVDKSDIAPLINDPELDAPLK